MYSKLAFKIDHKTSNSRKTFLMCGILGPQKFCPGRPHSFYPSPHSFSSHYLFTNSLTMPYVAHGWKTWSSAESANLEGSGNFNVLGLAGRNGSLQGMPDSVTCAFPLLLVEMIHFVLPCFPDPEALSAHSSDTEEITDHELTSPQTLGPSQQLCKTLCYSNRTH